MQIKKVLAALAVNDMAISEAWYARFLGRPADAHPMDGLVEWHFGEAVLQLVTDPKRAGGSLLTLQVDALGTGERERTSFGAEFRRELDPDGNALTLIAL